MTAGFYNPHARTSSKATGTTTRRERGRPDTLSPYSATSINPPTVSGGCVARIGGSVRLIHE